MLNVRGVETVSGGLEDGIDLIEGSGLHEALSGATVIVNVVNTGRFDREGAVEFFERTTRTLTEAGMATGVRHHVLLSIVGVGEGDASDQGYYLGKVAQERAVKAAGIPYTIVRSTQFQSYIPVLADQHTSDGVVHASRALIQPVEIDELVQLLVDVAMSDPLGEIELAGPEQYHLDDLFRATLAASGDAREVVTDEVTGPIDGLVPRGEYRQGTTLYPVRGIPLAS
ncbi:hypothetical protein L3i23_01950 [Herbiconiux sp. L3-i23]|nr:hypothetical protein L3i23_01950 [Herbiconiux sp. L3-i23]